MNCEPCLRLFIDLIHDLEDGAFFQEIVADLALQVSQDLEEFKAVHLWASHQLLQGIGQSRLQFNEGLYCLLIRLLEIRTVNIRKIFALEFIDQIFVGVCEVHFPNDIIIIDLKVIIIG